MPRSPLQELTLTPVAPALWLARHPLSFYGFKMLTCMTVVRLSDGSLWVHSPIPPTPGLMAGLAALGPVRHIVAPNRLHHLYALDFLAACPGATLYVAPGLTDKNPAFARYPAIPPAREAPWKGDIDAVFVEGNAELNETVFFHSVSRSLILTDLAVHIGPWDAFATRLYARLNGFYDRFGLSFLLKRFFKDREAARASLQRILAWDFERIVIAHGPVVADHPRERLRLAFAWLLPKEIKPSRS